jgi:hypothetical protein
MTNEFEINRVIHNENFKNVENSKIYVYSYDSQSNQIFYLLQIYEYTLIHYINI